MATSTPGGKSESIWVGARLRPLSKSEKVRKEKVALNPVDKRTLKIKEYYQRLSSAITASTLTYDAVFGSECANEDVYRSCAQDRVLSAMQGVNATLFVYGQTGSGKTYTMSNMVRLAATDIFKAIEQAPDREFLLKFTAVEIYNEKIKDLLVEGNEKQNLSLIEDAERGVVAEGCSDVGLETVNQLSELLKNVEARRTVRDTKMNAESSRSHQILQIYIESRPAVSEDDEAYVGDNYSLRPVKMSTINFVDLAGSERGSYSGQEGADRIRQTEGSAINKSLLTLGNVIRALGEAKTRGHVPYRDSKLTRLLQPSLGGNSRVAIICTLSPAACALEMSKAALHFANAAKRVTMQPVVNEVQNDRALIKCLQSEIDRLREQLATKDFAKEAADLSAQLQQKEQEVKLTVVEREKTQKQLQNLEKLILRAERADKDQLRRSSWSNMPRKLRNGAALERQATPLSASWHSPASSSNADALPIVAADALRKPTILNINTAAPVSRLVVDISSPSGNPLSSPARDSYWDSLLDDGDSYTESVRGDDTHRDVSGYRIRESQERAARAALKAEVRCISRGHGPSEDHMSTTLTRLKAELTHLQDQVGESGLSNKKKQDTVLALTAEIARLEAVHEKQRAADSALDSLQGKIAVLKLSQDSESCVDQSSARPPWTGTRRLTDVGDMADAESIAGDVTARSHTVGLNDDTPLMASPNASPIRETQHHDDTENWSSNSNVTPSQVPHSKLHATPASADAQWYKAQKKQMQGAFRSAAAQDVEELKSALEQQRDENARLECQKQLLLKQVLRTEARVDEAESAHAATKAQVQVLTDRVKAVESQLADANQLAEKYKFEAEKHRSEVVKARIGDLTRQSSSCSSSDLDTPEAGQSNLTRLQLPGSSNSLDKLTEPPLPGIGAHWNTSPPKVPHLPLKGHVPSHMLDTNDSWNASPSIENLMPRIAELWEKLHIPLIHRSRFYLAFRSRELFYVDAEKRRLSWLASEIGNPEDPNPMAAQKARRALASNQRKLDWEQKFLAQQIKWDFTPDEREEMFLAWNIHKESKQRKMQLVKRLWSAETLRETGGMQRSSEMVLRLHGKDANDGMFDLVFGRGQGDSAMKTMIATGSSMLAKIATPLRASSNLSPASSAGALPMVTRKKSFLSSIANQLTPRRSAASMTEQGTPLRQGSMAWTPRRSKLNKQYAE